MILEPFPHIVVDNFLDENICEKYLINFPSEKDQRWKREVGSQNKKLSIVDPKLYSDNEYLLLSTFNSSKFLERIEDITGIKGIVPDPHFFGGGFHCIEPGGFLNIHADFNFHPRTGLFRKLNLLLFLNKNWKEEYNGHLELWDYNSKKCIKRILPLYNRAVIFETSYKSLHGHPKLLTCPKGMSRKSVALYYYTNETPINDTIPRTTSYLKSNAF